MAPATRAKTGAKTGAKKKTASKMPAAKVTKSTKLTNPSKSAKTSKAGKIANALANTHDGRQETATEIQVQERPSAQKPTVVSKALVLKTDNVLGKIVAKYSANTADNSAKYDEDAGLYVLDSHTASRKPFAWEPVVIQSGDYKGYQALVLVPIPKKRFELQDLPLELRRVIYAEAFAAKDLELRAQGRVRGQTLGAWVKPGSRWDNKPRRTTLATFNTNLLRVSRNIFEEAADAFYSTTIHVVGWKGLLFFLESIGSCRRFVQSIVVNSDDKSYDSASTTAAAKYLAEATSLKKLQLKKGLYPAWGSVPYRTNYARDNREWLAKDFKPLLKKLHQQGKSVEDILKIVVWDIREYCWEHDPASSRRVLYYRLFHHGIGVSAKDCDECASTKHAYAIPMGEMKAKIVTVLEKEEPAPKPKPKPKLMPKPQVATRRDTGRPKRQGVTDRIVSYVESDDDEMEDVMEEDEEEEDEEADLDF